MLNTYSIVPLGSELVANVDHAGVELGLLGHTGGVEVSVPVNSGNLLLDRLVAKTVEVV